MSSLPYNPQIFDMGQRPQGGQMQRPQGGRGQLRQLLLRGPQGLRPSLGRLQGPGRGFQGAAAVERLAAPDDRYGSRVGDGSGGRRGGEVATNVR